jgi:hypothetical protein
VSDRTLGYKTIGCFGVAVIIVLFFAYLLNFVETLAHEHGAPNASARAPMMPPVYLPATPNASVALTDEVLQAANLDRLPALMAGTRQYARAHNGLLPPMRTLAAFRTALFPAYVTTDGVFVSLRTGTPYVPNPYLSNKPLAAAAAAGLPLFCEPLPAGISGMPRAVMFANGQLRKLSARSFAEAPKQLPAGPPPTTAAKR